MNEDGITTIGCMVSGVLAVDLSATDAISLI